MARVKRERDRFVGFVIDGVEGIPEADRIRGYARFVAPGMLEAGALQIEARSIVIATGSRPTIPPILQDLGDRLVVNDDIFEWDDLPRSVAVFGPGVIGLELGQALSRLGVRVVVLGRGGRLGPITDPVIRTAALKTLAAEFTLDPDAHVTLVERVGDQVEIDYRGPEGEARTDRFDYVLAATGRVPNVDALALEKLDIERDRRGVPLFDRLTLQVGDTSLFIAGDAADDAPILHEAADEGRIAGENAARHPLVKPGLRRAALGIVFTDPQIAIVGGGFAAVEASALAAGEVSFGDQGRARVMLRNHGHLRVYADPSTGIFLGAEMVGPDAEHIGHLLAWALQSRMTVTQMLGMPFYHRSWKKACAPRFAISRRTSLLTSEHRLAPLEALLRPILLPVVVLGHCRHPWGDDHPGLLARGEDVDAGRQQIGIVERADANEPHRGARPGVVAPHRDTARRAAKDLLSLAAVRRRVHHFRLALGEDHALGLDHRVQREGRAALPLAPAAVAAVDEEGLARHAVAHGAAVAAALQVPVLAHLANPR
jgi:dihydrolipoamide dehydrogenase